MNYKAILCLTALFLSQTQSASWDTGKSRRCIVNNNTNPRIQLSPTCESCRSSPVDATSTPLAMVIIASDDSLKSPLLPVASQLISSHFRVVVVHVFGSNRDIKEDHAELTLRNKITSSVPCKSVKPSLLSFKWVPVKGINGTVPLSSPYDALEEAEAEYQVLEFLVETDELPNVMVVCGVPLYTCCSH